MDKGLSAVVHETLVAEVWNLIERVQKIGSKNWVGDISDDEDLTELAIDEVKLE